MSDLIYISRNFTELGGFESREIIDFHKRSILSESDFVRVNGSDQWLPLHDWISGARNASPVKVAAGGKGKTKPKIVKSIPRAK
jgi:hypothetical protein